MTWRLAGPSELSLTLESARRETRWREGGRRGRFQAPLCRRGMKPEQIKWRRRLRRNTCSTFWPEGGMGQRSGAVSVCKREFSAVSGLGSSHAARRREAREL